MALRDQPYLPLYVQDFLTDEKLNECSAESTGVYIKIMCLMHKSKHYGKLYFKPSSRQIRLDLPKQTDKQTTKQTEKQVFSFASMVASRLVRHLPFSEIEIKKSLVELVTQDVLQIEGDFLCQKRMIRDNELSIKRSRAGHLGGKANAQKILASKFAKAKVEANIQASTEYEYEYENEIKIKEIRSGESLNFLTADLTFQNLNPKSQKSATMIVERIAKVFIEATPDYFFHRETDYPACLQIAYHIAKMEGWPQESVCDKKQEECVKRWGEIVAFIKTDEWLSVRSLTDIATIKEWQRLVQKINANKKQKNGKSGVPNIGKDIEFDKA